MVENSTNNKTRLSCDKGLSRWNIEILSSNFSLQFAGVLINGFVISVYLVDILKASPAFIGLITGIAMFQGVLQPLSAMIVRKIKHRRQFSVTALFIARIIYLGSLVYGYFASIHGHIIYPLIAILCFIATFVQSLSLELNSWFVDLTTSENRAHHLTIRNTLTYIGAMVGILSAGLVLRYTENIVSFMILFSAAFVFFVISFIILSNTYHPPKVIRENVENKDMFKPIVKDKNFIAFLITVTLSCIGFYITMPFFNIFYLEYLKIPYDMLGFANAAATLSLALGYLFWGKMMPMLGARLLSKITILLLAIIPLLWFLITPNKSSFIYILLIMLFYSFIQGGWSMSQFAVTFNICKDENSISYISLYYAIVGICAFIAPNIGGVLIELYGKHPILSTTLHINNPIMITFILSFLINMICIIFYPTYKINKERSNLRLRDVLMRIDAISVLYKLTSAAFLPTVIRSRKRAAEEMGETKTVVALPKLITMLDDLDQNVRLLAIQSIGQILDSEARDILITFSSDANILEKQMIINSLGNFRDENTIDFLLNIYNSKYPALRMAAANALASHPNEKVKDFVTTLIGKKKYTEHDYLIHLSVAATNKAYEIIPYIIKHYHKQKISKYKERILYYLSMMFNIDKQYYQNYYQYNLKSCRKNITKLSESIDSLGSIISDNNKKVYFDRAFKAILISFSLEENVSFDAYSSSILSLIADKTCKEKLYAIEYFLHKKNINANEINFLTLSITNILKSSKKNINTNEKN